MTELYKESANRTEKMTKYWLTSFGRSQYQKIKNENKKKIIVAEKNENGLFGAWIIFFEDQYQ